MADDTVARSVESCSVHGSCGRSLISDAAAAHVLICGDTIALLFSRWPRRQAAPKRMVEKERKQNDIKYKNRRRLYASAEN